MWVCLLYTSLSKVLFIATANDLGSIPEPLRDRLEIIEISSYTEQEKLQIAKRHLLKKELERHGLKAEQLMISDETMMSIIRPVSYTHLDVYKRQLLILQLN